MGSYGGSWFQHADKANRMIQKQLFTKSFESGPLLKTDDFWRKQK